MTVCEMDIWKMASFDSTSHSTTLVVNHRFDNQSRFSATYTPLSVILDAATTVIAFSKTDCDNIYSEILGRQLISRHGVYPLWCNGLHQLIQVIPVDQISGLLQRI